MYTVICQRVIKFFKERRTRPHQQNRKYNLVVHDDQGITIEIISLSPESDEPERLPPDDDFARPKPTKRLTDDANKTTRMGRWGDPPASPQPSSNRRGGWLNTKQLDQLPGEWTYNVNVQRVIRFHGQPRYLYYEPTWNLDVLAMGAWLSAALRRTFGRPLASQTVAFEAFEGIYDAPNGVIALPGKDERFVGSHNVRVSGWEPDTSFFGFAIHGDRSGEIVASVSYLASTWNCTAGIRGLAGEARVHPGRP